MKNSTTLSHGTKARLRLPISLLLVSVLTFAVASATFASKADDMLKEAASVAKKADAARGTADRRDLFKEAIDSYAEIAKKFPGTPQGAEALYQSAIVHEKSATRKTEYGNLFAAYETLSQLVNVYGKPVPVLEDELDLSRTDAREAKRVAELGKKLRVDYGDRLDKINSEKLQYKVLDFFVAITGRIPGFSYWFAIILITVLVKLLITPLTKKQFAAMKEMQKVAPLIKELQAKYKGDQKTIGEKTMDLYKEHGINPFASCLPLLVQMPILMLLYYTIQSYQFQFAKATFIWIGSGLSHLYSFQVPFQAAGKLVWITARNLSEPDLILVLLYVISMYVSTKLSAVDPSQAEQQKMMAVVMPFMFAFIFAGFPSAFLLYWLVFNILQTVQQYMILRGSGEAELLTPAPALPEKPDDDDDSGGSQRVRRRRRR